MKPGSPLTLFATMPGACRFLASASVIRQWRRHLAVKLCAPQRSCTAKPRRLHITVRAYFGAGKSTYRDTLPFAGGGTRSLPACFDVTARAKPARLWGFAIASGIWKVCSSIQKVFLANKDINCWLISCISDFRLPFSDFYAYFVIIISNLFMRNRVIMRWQLNKQQLHARLSMK